MWSVGSRALTTHSFCRSQLKLWNPALASSFLNLCSHLLQDAASLGVAGENCRLCGARIQTYLLEKAGEKERSQETSERVWDPAWDVFSCRCGFVINRKVRGTTTSSTRTTNETKQSNTMTSVTEFVLGLEGWSKKRNSSQIVCFAVRHAQQRPWPLNPTTRAPFALARVATLSEPAVSDRSSVHTRVAKFELVRELAPACTWVCHLWNWARVETRQLVIGYEPSVGTKLPDGTADREDSCKLRRSFRFVVTSTVHVNLEVVNCFFLKVCSTSSVFFSPFSCLEQNIFLSYLLFSFFVLSFFLPLSSLPFFSFSLRLKKGTLRGSKTSRRNSRSTWRRKRARSFAPETAKRRTNRRTDWRIPSFCFVSKREEFAKYDRICTKKQQFGIANVMCHFGRASATFQLSLTSPVHPARLCGLDVVFEKKKRKNNMTSPSTVRSQERCRWHWDVRAAYPCAALSFGSKNVKLWIPSGRIPLSIPVYRCDVPFLQCVSSADIHSYSGFVWSVVLRGWSDKWRGKTFVQKRCEKLCANCKSVKWRVYMEFLIVCVNAVRRNPHAVYVLTGGGRYTRAVCLKLKISQTSWLETYRKYRNHKNI